MNENEATNRNEAIVDEGEAPASGSSGEPSSNDAPASASGDPVAAAQAEAARNKEMWMRTAADFDNFRKRARREVDDARRGGREDLLKDLLPVFDNLERAIQSAQKATDVKAVSDGVGMILKQFESTLGRVGIAKVATTGTPFDPTVHEAIQQVETDDHPPGNVMVEVQPGYVQNERLVRPAMVIVAKSPSGGEGPKSGRGDSGEKN